MRRTKLIPLIVIIAIGLVAGIVWFNGIGSEKPPRPPGPPAVAASHPPPSLLKNAYFGELHLHTTYSVDANIFGTVIDPRMAYRFAKGEEVWLPLSRQFERLKAPLDFAAVTDHAEGLGMYQQCNDAHSENYWSLTCLGTRFKLKLMFRQLFGSLKQEGAHTGRYNASVCGEDGALCKTSARTIWKAIQDAANEAYQPGVFTSFIGFEYSPTLNSGGMVHRNVIFRGTAVPDNVFSALDGFAEDLLRWLDNKCSGACQALSIPHNPNFSWGLMFGETNSDATPLTRENLALRAKLERLVEVFQIKGSSECAMGFGNSDEECGFENIWPVCSEEQTRVDPTTGQHTPRCVGPNDMVRQVLKKGLLDEKRWGFNPFKLGFVGATDNHNGLPGDTEESTWNGHGGEPDSKPEYRLGYEKNMVAETLGFSLTALNPGGLTGVWAEQNTREAIFDALSRKESFATSGTRIRVRLFGGFDYPADLHQRSDALAAAYAGGVPMGGELAPAAEGQTATFMVQALRDPNSAPLQKIQIVKGWVADGQTHELVYDVACADGLQPDATTHLCADNDAKVNLADCTVSTDKGAAELSATWSDPEFRAGDSAFYYARVLEDPSCRWSQYDANRIGKPHPDGFPGGARQRAWTSPIWYEPQG